MRAPRPVIRGEVAKAEALSVGVDWLAFTFFPPGVDELMWPQLEHFLSSCFGAAGYVDGTRGWNGYTRSAKVGGVLIAWGGSHQGGSVHVEIPGAVCADCESWPTVVEWLATFNARITRVDLCGDDLSGAHVSVDWAIAQFRSGGFEVARAPRRPHVELRDDLGTNEGRTLYVGKRENGKLARVYEKGKQLGDKSSPWCRFEVELRAKDRFLSFDILLRPAAFLAGAFPCASLFASVSERVRTFKEKARISFSQLVGIARRQSGRAINAMMAVYGGDLGQVVSLLRRSGMPSRIDPADLRALAGAT